MTKLRSVGVAVVALALAGVAARLAVADPPGPPAAKGRWEYKAVKRLDIEALAPTPHKPAAGPAVYEGQSPENLGQGLNVLAADGWELVAIEPYHTWDYRDGPTGSNVHMRYHVTYVFKRAR